MLVVLVYRAFFIFPIFLVFHQNNSPITVQWFRYTYKFIFFSFESGQMEKGNIYHLEKAIPLFIYRNRA